MTDFDIEVFCAACGASFEVSRIRRGSTEKCPVCRQEVSVPGQLVQREVAPAPEPATSPSRSSGVSVDGPAPERSGRYVICLNVQGRVNPLVVAPVLCDVLDTIPAQIKMELRRGKGLLAENLHQDAADEVIWRLRREDVDAFAVDQSQVPRIDRRIKVVRIYGLDAEAVQLQSDVHGTIRQIPTTAVAAAFCTRKKQIRGGPTELKTEYVRGGPTGSYRRTYRAKAREPEPEAQCTILARGQSGQIYAIGFKQSQVRYSYLEHRLKPSSAQNFCVLAADLIENCTQAFFPEAMTTVAKGRFNAVTDLETDNEAQQYERWVLCCLARQWYGAMEPE